MIKAACAERMVMQEVARQNASLTQQTIPTLRYGSTDLSYWNCRDQNGDYLIK